MPFVRHRKSRSRTSTFLVPSILCVLCASQLIAASKFHWNWRAARELSWKQSVNRLEARPTPVKEVLIQAAVAELRPIMADLGIRSEEELRAAAAETRVEFVSLGRGLTVVVAQAGGKGCTSATGNCPFWIFKPGKGGYSVILDGEAQTFTLQPTYTNGLKDVVLGFHSSAFETQLAVYRFNGKVYVEDDCYMADWDPDAVGKAQKPPEPRVTRCTSK